jgi:hypothetical protein
VQEAVGVYPAGGSMSNVLGRVKVASDVVMIAHERLDASDSVET